VPPTHQHPDEPQPRPDLIAAAARHAQIGARDTGETVAAGVGVHRFQHRTSGLLTLGAGGQGAPRALQLGGQIVAQLLELPQAEQARSAAAGHDDIDRVEREAGDQGVGQLTLEPGDLAPQRAARRVLVERRGGLQQVAVGDHDHA
jgi:hypothetical protein